MNILVNENTTVMINSTDVSIFCNTVTLTRKIPQYKRVECWNNTIRNVLIGYSDETITLDLLGGSDNATINSLIDSFQTNDSFVIKVGDPTIREITMDAAYPSALSEKTDAQGTLITSVTFTQVRD